MNDSLTSIFTASKYMTTVFFIVLLTLEILAIKKIKISNFDKSALVIMKAYSLCMLTKAISLYILDYESSINDALAFKIVNLLNMITDMIVWAILFYFVFEMRAVYDLVSSTTHLEYRRKRSISSCLKIAYLGFSSTLTLIYHICAGVYMFDS